MLDYPMSALLFFSPEIFGFSGSEGAETMIPRVLGAAMAGTALMTRYELGAVKVLPMTTHLAMDVAAGAFLAASPWLFGFSEVRPATLAFSIMGLFEVATALTTRTVPNLQKTQIAR